MRKLLKNKLVRFIAIGVVVAVVFSVFFVKFFQLKSKEKQQDERIAALQETYNQISEENKELEEAISHSEDESYIEQYARDNYDFVYPGERVYYNSEQY